MCLHVINRYLWVNEIWQNRYAIFEYVLKEKSLEICGIYRIWILNFVKC